MLPTLLDGPVEQCLAEARGAVSGESSDMAYRRAGRRCPAAGRNQEALRLRQGATRAFCPNAARCNSVGEIHERNWSYVDVKQARAAIKTRVKSVCLPSRSVTPASDPAQPPCLQTPSTTAHPSSPVRCRASAPRRRTRSRNPCNGCRPPGAAQPRNRHRVRAPP